MSSKPVGNTFCDLEDNRFVFTVKGRDLRFYGFETVDKFKKYKASLSINTLFDLTNHNFNIEYSDAAWAVREALIAEYKVYKRAQRFKTMTPEEIDEEWDRLNLYEKSIADPHQKRTVLFAMEVKKALIFLDMGLGKSYIASTILQNLIDNKLVEPGKILIIAPKTLHTKDNWPGELTKFSDLSLQIVKDYDDFKSDADVFLVNSERFRIICQDEDGEYDPMNHFVLKKFKVIVFDESAKLKNGRSQITQVFAEYARRLTIPYIYMLTGLPSPNNAFQLWGQAASVGNWLGDEYVPYENRYGHQLPKVQFKKMVLNNGAIEEIKERIELCSISFTEEILNLPPYPIEDVYVDLDPVHFKLYDQIQEEYYCILDAINSNSKERIKMLADTEPAVRMKLLQTVIGYINVKDRYGVTEPTTLKWHPKLDRVMSDLEEILADPENNVIIWTRFREEFQLFYAAISAKWTTAYGIGGMSGKEQREQLALWLDNKDCRVMIANPGAFMAGHTWLKANYTFYPTPLDDYEHYAQSRKRNHRRGQTRTVYERRYLGKGTLEKKMWTAMEHKKRLNEFLKSR